MEFFLVIGFLLVTFSPYIYFKKSSGMSDKVYLTLLALGSVFLLIGLSMIPANDKGLMVYFLMIVSVLLLILTGIDAINAYSGKVTKYEKQRLEQIKQANEAKKVMEEKNQHFKM